MYLLAGGSPYPGLDMDEEFVKRLQGGYRMQRPTYASQEVLVSITSSLISTTTLSYWKCTNEFLLQLFAHFWLLESRSRRPTVLSESCQSVWRLIGWQCSPGLLSLNHLAQLLQYIFYLFCLILQHYLDLSELYQADRATPNGYIDMASDKVRAQVPAVTSSSDGDVVMTMDPDNVSVHYLKPVSNNKNGVKKSDYYNEEQQPFIDSNASGDATRSPQI